MIPALNSFIMCNALKLSYNFVVICEAVVKHSVALCCISVYRRCRTQDNINDENCVTKNSDTTFFSSFFLTKMI